MYPILFKRLISLRTSAMVLQEVTKPSPLVTTKKLILSPIYKIWKTKSHPYDSKFSKKLPLGIEPKFHDYKSSVMPLYYRSSLQPCRSSLSGIQDCISLSDPPARRYNVSSTPISCPLHSEPYTQSSNKNKSGLRTSSSDTPMSFLTFSFALGSK